MRRGAVELHQRGIGFKVDIWASTVPPLLLGEPWNEWIHKGLTILLIGCPCALANGAAAGNRSASAWSRRMQIAGHYEDPSPRTIQLPR